MSDYITTYSKIHFTPLEPRQEDISIADIAHALSLMTRANGHFPEFYSVGQHCIHCAQEAIAEGLSRRLVLACLLHDASEAYLADITRPVKKNLENYIKIEERLLNAIYEHFLGNQLSQKEWTEVKRIDDTLLYYEFSHYMGEFLMDDAPEIKKIPVFETRNFKDVENEYLQLFQAYKDLH